MPKLIPDTSAVAALTANAAKPFERAHAMPPSVYTSDEFLAAEIEHVFKQDWFCAGRASSLPESGDFSTLELAGQPVMVIRDKNGELKAHSNVCLHRMSTLLHGRGNTRSIVCPYHAWTYNLDGSLARRTGNGGQPELLQKFAQIAFSAMRSLVGMDYDISEPRRPDRVEPASRSRGASR